MPRGKPKSVPSKAAAKKPVAKKATPKKKVNDGAKE